MSLTGSGQYINRPWISRKHTMRHKGSLVEYAEFGTPLKLITFLKLCLNETYSTVDIGKRLIRFPFRNPWRREMLYRHCVLTWFQDMALWRPKKLRRPWNWMEHINCSSMQVMIIYRTKTQIRSRTDNTDTLVFAWREDSASHRGLYPHSALYFK